MKLLTNKSAWAHWMREEIGVFKVQTAPEPKAFPCFAYAVLDSWGQETLLPQYLYRKNIEAMALDLVAAEGMGQ